MIYLDNEIRDYEIAEYFKVHRTFISHIRTGDRKITKRMADMLHEFDNSLTVKEWREVTFNEFKQTMGKMIKKESKNV